MCRSIPDEFGQNWRPELYEDMIVRREQKDNLTFSAIFQELLEKRVIRPGFELKCENCFFYRLVPCKRIFRRIRLSFLLYQAESQLCSQEGVAVQGRRTFQN
jgi:hypothetical protein